MSREPFIPLSFEQVPHWGTRDMAPAFGAFRRSAERLLSAAVATGSLGVRADALLHAASQSLDANGGDPRAFFERHFAPALIRANGERGFLTGYFEPVLSASRRRDARFSVPLHARPADPSAFDRAAVAAGALDGQGLEIAYLENAVDAFFVHVQGSARLSLVDGPPIRVGYAAKSGHAYTSIGRVLVEMGELTLEEADMDGLRRWLGAHPERQREILDRNRSYIYFAERDVPGDEGPIGAAGIALTPMGSIALDGTLHTYGMPLFVHAPVLVLQGEPFAELLIAQDTGSAIRGPARGDLFVGSGEEAGRVAGRIRHSGDFYALLPKGHAR